jgi:hypothetical protein
MDFPHFRHERSNALRMALTKPAQILLHLVFDNIGLDTALDMHNCGSFDVRNACVTSFNIQSPSVNSRDFMWVCDWSNQIMNVEAMQNFGRRSVENSLRTYINGVVARYNILAALYKKTDHVELQTPRIDFDGHTVSINSPEQIKPDLRSQIEKALASVDPRQTLASELAGSFSFKDLLGLSPYDVVRRNEQAAAINAQRASLIPNF